MKEFFNRSQWFLFAVLIIAAVSYGDLDTATSDPSNEFLLNGGIENQPFFLQDVEPIYYSGKFQSYDTAVAKTLRVTVTTDNETTILEETDPTDAGSFELRPADYALGYHLLKHEILDGSGNVLATMQKGFFVLDAEKVEIHFGELSKNETWSTNKVHIIYKTLMVPSGRTLRIASGAIVKFFTGASIDISSGASCIANGTIFTHINDDAVGGDTLSDGAVTVPMDAYSINGNLTYNDSTVFRFLSESLEELSGTIDKNTELKGNKTYIVSGALTLSGCTLTIPPGTVLKMKPGSSIKVENNAYLKAIGTRFSPITITSIKDDSVGGDTNNDGDASYPQSGDWCYIYSYGKVDMDYVNIYYGGALEKREGSGERGPLMTYSGSLCVNNSVVGHSLYDGIWNWGGSIAVTNSVIFDTGWATAPLFGKNSYVNCVFYGNDLILCYWSYWAGNPEYKNCIFAECSKGWCELSADTTGDPPSGVHVNNCLFWNPENYGPQSCGLVGQSKNIWGDPLFLDAEKGDFRISEYSPCVDAGDSDAAPEFDYYGHNRATIRLGHVGNEPAADIGIFEVLSDDLKADIDLIPISVTSETNAVPGETISIEWEVKNEGIIATRGSWRDTISLVNEYGNEVKLGDSITTTKLEGKATLSCSGVFTIPAISEGNWKLKVNVNSYHDIFEGYLSTNNALVSQQAINVALKEIDPNVPGTGVINAGTPTIVKLVFSETNENRMVMFTLPKGVKITWGFGSMPSSGISISGLYGTSTSDGSIPVRFRVPEGAVDVYVILESNESASYEVSTDTSKLSVIRVLPKELPCSGTTSISVECAGFGVTNVLVLANGSDSISLPIEAIDINGYLVTSLDCSKLAAGKTYDVTLKSDDDEAFLKNGVTVTQEEGKGILEFESDIPTIARPGRVFTFVVKYRNVGNLKLCCPIVTIQDTGDDEENPMQFSLDGSTFIPGELKFVGLDANGYLDGLNPGDEVTLHMTACIPPANNGSTTISVNINSESDIMAQYTTEIDNYITPMMKQEYEQSTNEEFRVYFENLQKLLGSNNGEMVRNFAALAKRYFDNNKFYLLGIDNLITVGLDIANNDEDEEENEGNSIASGKLIKQLSRKNTIFAKDHKETGAYFWNSNGAVYIDYSTKEDLSKEGVKVAVIAHGLEDSIDSQWMKEMGNKLEGKGYRVIFVDWSKEASSSFWTKVFDGANSAVFIPTLVGAGATAALAMSNPKIAIGVGLLTLGSAIVGGAYSAWNYNSDVAYNIINTIATKVCDQLNVCQVDPQKTIFIGYGWGATILDNIALKFKGARIIGLDSANTHYMSETTEYYRSSPKSDFAEPYADYNYIVAKKGRLGKGGHKITDDGNESYAVKWFTDSIDHKTKGVGFWAENGKPKNLQNLGKDGFAAVINDNFEVECTYKLGDPAFFYPGYQPNVTSTIYMWKKSYDLDIRDNGKVHLADDSTMKACQEKTVWIDIKDNADIKTVYRSLNKKEIKASFTFKDSSGNTVVIGCDSSTTTENHYPLKIKIPNDIIPKDKKSINGTLRFVVNPVIKKAGIFGTGGILWNELYIPDNIREIPITIERSEGPTAAIGINVHNMLTSAKTQSLTSNSRHYTTHFIYTKTHHFASHEKYFKAASDGKQIKVELTGAYSDPGEADKITSYYWRFGYNNYFSSNKKTCSVYINATSEFSYPVRLTVGSDSGYDELEGHLYYKPIIAPDPKPVEPIASFDPNEMSGPLGVGDSETERFVKPGEWLTYTVFFENTSNATAAAQEIYVTNELNKWLDWSTFEMGEIVFNNNMDLNLVGRASGTSEVKVNGTNYSVRTELTLDDKSGVAKWYMRIVDPATETGWPEDVLIGFLPPNDETYRGEGHLTYRIKLREDAPAGVRIDNSATIVFDYNDPIETDPAWWNTVAKMQMVRFEGGLTNLNLVVGAPYGELPVLDDRDGWLFIGWFTGQDGTGRHITADSLVEEGDDVLYAYWTANAYTVNYNANGGEGEMESQNVAYDMVFDLSPNKFTRKYYKFGGWATNETGSVVYSDGETVSNLTAVAGGVVDLYAIWNTFSTQIKINIDGTETNLNLVVGSSYGELPVPAERTGWTFVGWFTEPDGSGRCITADSTVEEEDGNLYAYWTANAYTINYNANGGEGEMESQDAVYGMEFSLSSNTFTRTYYEFTGWATNETSSVVYSDGETVSNLTAVAGGEVDLYACWTQNTYTVNYNANGGEGEMESQVVAYGMVFNLSPNTFTRTNYKYTGWATNETGSVVYSDGETVSNLTAVAGGVVDLYAVWESLAVQIRIDFGGNETNLNLFIGSPYGELPVPAERIGWTFIGWFTEPDGGGRQITKDTIVQEDDGALYAYWTQNAYTVNYNSNGGEGEMESQTVAYGMVFNLSSNTFTRTNYKYTGWATNETGSVVFNDGEMVSNLTAVAGGVVDLYAVWESLAVQIKIDFDGSETNLNLFVGSPYGELPIPAERKGWVFVGWFTGPDGTGRLVTAETLVEEGDETLYQYWVRKTHNLVEEDEENAVISIYDGYIFDPNDHNIAGCLQAKIGNSKNGKCKVTVTITMAGGVKTDAKAEMDMSVGKLEAFAKNGKSLKLTFGANDLSGTFDNYEVDGARNIFTSKNAADQANANAALGAWKGAYTVVWESGTGYTVISASIGAKGKAKATGFLSNGTKFSASGQFIVGEKENCVVLVSKNQNVPLAFNLWLISGESLEAEGLNESYVIAKAGQLNDGAFFECEYLTEKVPVSVQGKKWVTTSNKETALKLIFKDKTGMFKGSFNVGTQKASVNGVVIEGIGYGSAVIKGSGSKSVLIK